MIMEERLELLECHGLLHWLCIVGFVEGALTNVPMRLEYRVHGVEQWPR